MRQVVGSCRGSVSRRRALLTCAAAARAPAAEAIPKLEWLILTNNRLSNLAVSGSAGCPHVMWGTAAELALPPLSRTRGISPLPRAAARAAAHAATT